MEYTGLGRGWQAAERKFHTKILLLPYELKCYFGTRRYDLAGRRIHILRDSVLLCEPFHGENGARSGDCFLAVVPERQIRISSSR